MPESLSAKKPKVDDAIPSMNPGESPQDYKERLVAASSYAEPLNPSDEMLDQQAMAKFRDEKPMPEEPKKNDEEAA